MKKVNHIIIFGMMGIILLFIIIILVLRSPMQTEVTSQLQSHLNMFETPGRLKTVSGEEVSISPRSIPTLVTAWATWSPYTTTEFVILEGLRDKYTQEELRIIALNRRESFEIANRYLASYPPPNNVEVIIDVDDVYYSTIGGFTMPESILYDINGDILHHFRGPLNFDIVSSYID